VPNGWGTGPAGPEPRTKVNPPWTKPPQEPSSVSKTLPVSPWGLPSSGGSLQFARARSAAAFPAWRMRARRHRPARTAELRCCWKPGVPAGNRAAASISRSWRTAGDANPWGSQTGAANPQPASRRRVEWRRSLSCTAAAAAPPHSANACCRAETRRGSATRTSQAMGQPAAPDRQPPSSRTSSSPWDPSARAPRRYPRISCMCGSLAPAVPPILGRTPTHPAEAPCAQALTCSHPAEPAFPRCKQQPLTLATAR